jgi:hypothetical protein
MITFITILFGIEAAIFVFALILLAVGSPKTYSLKDLGLG